MNKRLIKKKVKDMSDNEICEHVAYGSGYWRHFAELEFDRRFVVDGFSIKDWEEVNVPYFNE